MTSKNQVSPVIRISRGERDASARATHLEAANGKFLLTTNERKQMSTTTNFKRIALVAVAALGLGVLSSVPSQATISGLSVTTTNGTSTAIKSDSTTAGIIAIAGLFEVSDSITVTLVESSIPSGGVSKVTMMNRDSSTATLTGVAVETLTAAASTSSGAPIAAGAALALGATTDAAANGAAAVRITKTGSAANLTWNIGVQMDSATSTRASGTYTWSVLVKRYDAGSTTLPVETINRTISITVAALSTESKDASAATSTAILTGAGDWSTASTVNDSIVATVATASGTPVASVKVDLKNAAGGQSTVRDSITVTIDKGNAAIVASAGATTPQGKSLAPYSYVGSTVYVQVFPDGSSGPATLTIATKNAGTYTKTINFFTAAAKTITATVATPVAKIGTNAKAVRGVAVDANGLAWTGAAYIVASSAADALIAGSTTPVLCAYSAADARHDCDVTAIAAGTAKFKIIDAATVALATATSNEVTVTVANSVATSVKIEFDKATYAPNERARIYVTPLDATGKAIQQGTYTNILSSTGISVNGAVSYAGTTTTADSFTASTLTSARNFTTADQTSSTSGNRAGSQVFTVYMPSSGGVVTLTATGGSSLPTAGQVALTATATVTDSGAAALAAVTALATTVASLRTLIVTLTNLVLKIQKKVRA